MTCQYPAAPTSLDVLGLVAPRIGQPLDALRLALHVLPRAPSTALLLMRRDGGLHRANVYPQRSEFDTNDNTPALSEELRALVDPLLAEAQDPLRHEAIVLLRRRRTTRSLP